MVGKIEKRKNLCILRFINKFKIKNDLLIAHRLKMCYYREENSLNMPFWEQYSRA